MVLDLGVSNLPMWLFMAVHLTALAAAAYFASKSFTQDRRSFAWGFTLYAIAEVLYMGYHVGVTTFLLSHTLAEALDLVAFVLVFLGVGQTVAQRRSAAHPSASR